MLAHLKRLFKYDHWANREAVRSLRAGRPTERSLKVMAHVAAAQRLWLDRLLAQPQSMAVWPALTLEQSEKLVGEMADAWRGYLEALTPAGLGARIAYRNTKGEQWTNTVGDVLMHVVMHSAYHRGQIAADVRASGSEPAYTDYIEAVRRGSIEDREAREDA